MPSSEQVLSPCQLRPAPKQGHHSRPLNTTPPHSLHLIHRQVLSILLPKYIKPVTFSPSHGGLPDLSHPHSLCLPDTATTSSLAPASGPVSGVCPLSGKHSDLLKNTNPITSPLLKTPQCLPSVLELKSTSVSLFVTAAPPHSLSSGLRIFSPLSVALHIHYLCLSPFWFQFENPFSGNCPSLTAPIPPLVRCVSY